MEFDLRVRGIVIYSAPVGEYDKRIVFLSQERGRMTIFANGARRQGSRIAACTRSFCMGTFTVREGRSSYYLISADIEETFPALADDMTRMCYASYVCELMLYYSREELPAAEELNLLYVTFRNLAAGDPDYRKIRSFFEMRLLAVEGEGADERHFSTREDVTELLRLIKIMPLKKLYSLNAPEETLLEMSDASLRYIRTHVDKELRSLLILDTLY